MKRSTLCAGVLLFAAGLAVGKIAQVDPARYHGKSKQEAAKVLLDQARVEAGDGSWERIAIGRVYYLGGDKAQGQAIFDEVLNGRKVAQSDRFRVARIYREAGEWGKAKALFDRYAQDNPNDQKELAEIGAYYLLNGDRAAAEGLFDRAFAKGSELWVTLAAAGAYLGVVPEE